MKKMSVDDYRRVVSRLEEKVERLECEMRAHESVTRIAKRVLDAVLRQEITGCPGLMHCLREAVARLPLKQFPFADLRKP
jgi:hypothetical protein